MTKIRKRIMLAAALGAAIVTPVSLLADNEFGSNTPYYEDDAWYDVSEWFDGNDYNPTDEAIGRWDDEVFTFADNATSSDNDNFLNLGSYGDYGYTSTDDDWFYDYYDDGYSYWYDRSYTSYYDVDDDGVYDSFASYTDTDRDGFYEDFTYYTFNEDSQSGQREAKQDAENQQKAMKATRNEFSGTVQKTKQVSVRDRAHLVAMIESSNGQTIPVDLGPKQSDMSLSKGDQLTAKGHLVKVGDKSILIASDASTQSGSVMIDRNGKKYSGTIKSLKTVELRGIEHTLAKVSTANGKMMMVDFGPKDQLDSGLVKQGAKLTIQGVPVKVGDRVALMAEQVTHDGDKAKIDRRVAQQ